MTSILQRAALNQQAWDALFDFLDPARRERVGANRDTIAEARYMEIRRKLECFFAGRACSEADDLADETTLRVTARCADLSGSDTNPLAYFYGVARNVLHEWQRNSQRELRKLDAVRRDPTNISLSGPSALAGEDSTHRCLARCMTTLTYRARHLILRYYCLLYTSPSPRDS